MDVPPFFYITIGLIFFYFSLQYFFTQIFYSKNKILIPFIAACCVPVIVYFIPITEQKIEGVLDSLSILYYSIILFLIKKYYLKFNHFLIKNNRLKKIFSGKDFTYVSYHKGIFDRGNSWDEELASNPSWLDHILTATLIIFPIALVVFSEIIYKHYNNAS